jgi:hypothetical protein
MKVRSFFTFSILLVALAFEPLFNSYSTHAATTWVVDTLSDVLHVNCNPGMCSLRDAIAFAANNDTITFSVTGIIRLNHGTLTLNKDLTISGPGAGNLSIDGLGYYQAFNIPVGKTVILLNLTITHGTSVNGGGIYNEGNLTINQCTVSDHTATGDGGGLYNKGTVTVSRSTFSGNHASNGGGIKNEGGVLSVTNSTFTGNVAGIRGGGIDSSSNSTLAVTNSTFRDNSATTGGGISNPSSVSTAKNVLMAGNGGWNCNGQFANGSTHNLTTDATCSPGFAQVLPAQLALGVLMGNPAYFPLRLGSAAIDTGTNDGCPALDEPGMPRPQDGDHDGAAVCDVGAFEAMPYAIYLPLLMHN